MAKQTLTQKLQAAEERIALLEQQLEQAEEENANQRERHNKHFLQLQQVRETELQRFQEHATRVQDSMRSEHQTELARLDGAASMARQIVGDLAKGQKQQSAGGFPPGLIPMLMGLDDFG